MCRLKKFALVCLRYLQYILIVLSMDFTQIHTLSNCVKYTTTATARARMTVRKYKQYMLLFNVVLLECGGRSWVGWLDVHPLQFMSKLTTVMARGKVKRQLIIHTLLYC